MLTALAEGLKRLSQSEQRAEFCEVLADVRSRRKRFPAQYLGSLLLNDLCVRGGH